MFNLEHLLKVIDPEPIQVDHQACLAARHRRSTCRACIEACPTSALKFEEGRVTVENGACTRCSLCAPVCPTAAVTVRGLDEAAITSATGIYCAKADGLGVQVPCLGYLTTDHLIYLGLRSETLELTRGDCGGCSWQRGGAMAEQAVDIAREALKAVGSPGTMRMVARGADSAAADPKPGERALSRRDLFNLWRVESVQVARQMMPAKEVNHAKLPAKLPVRRSRWLRLKHPDQVPVESLMPTGPWKARVVTDACNGCGICAAFCPTGAFAKSQEEDTWILTHQPAACVGCNTCVDLCPPKVVGEEPLAARMLVEGKVRELVRLTSNRCKNCRREFKGQAGEAQCPQCRSIHNMLRG